MDATEEEIIARCQRGDRAAFQLLVARYQRRAYGIAYGMLRNSDDAMDAAQDAFVKVLRNIHGFKGESSFYTWFYRIVVNVCIDHCRKHRKFKNVEYDDTYKRRDESDGVAPLVGNTRPLHPGFSFENDELGQVLNAALDTLTENHRTIILLREVEGLSYEEIAETMDCHLGTVMSRLHHARKNLQKALKPYLDAAGNPLGDRAGAGVRKPRKEDLE
ncbi:MAG: sigma-70 family RNA polymerase sigma factor [Myxococcales bacterium]|nr:sigma-70 family RNA polymerase sigma factor [Myxococcales bacterium]